MKTLILLSLAATLAVAQTPERGTEPPPKFYKLDLVVKELDGGKTVGSRAYSLSVALGSSHNKGSVRTGDRVPTVTGRDGQFGYIDVGVNIDCFLTHATPTELVIRVLADISSIMEKTGGGPPVVNQTKWNSGVVVPLRKPTTVYSADGASTKRQTQLEITATPLQ